MSDYLKITDTEKIPVKAWYLNKANDEEFTSMSDMLPLISAIINTLTRIKNTSVKKIKNMYKKEFTDTEKMYYEKQMKNINICYEHMNSFTIRLTDGTTVKSIRGINPIFNAKIKKSNSSYTGGPLLVKSFESKNGEYPLLKISTEISMVNDDNYDLYEHPEIKIMKNNRYAHHIVRSDFIGYILCSNFIMSYILSGKIELETIADQDVGKFAYNFDNGGISIYDDTKNIPDITFMDELIELKKISEINLT